MVKGGNETKAPYESRLNRRRSHAVISGREDFCQEGWNRGFTVPFDEGLFLFSDLFDLMDIG